MFEFQKQFHSNEKSRKSAVKIEEKRQAKKRRLCEEPQGVKIKHCAEAAMECYMRSAQSKQALLYGVPFVSRQAEKWDASRHSTDVPIAFIFESFSKKQMAVAVT